MILRALFVSVLLLAGGLLGACNAQPGVCGVRVEEMLRPDGGFYGCPGPEECPVTSSTYLCVTDLPLQMRPCVDCLDLRCVRRIPEPCR